MTQEEALAILKSGASVFLTGEPGSGKSYVAGQYIRALRAEGVPVSITASTGIAAAQIGGMTIHAWSGIGMRQQIARADLDAIAKNRRVTERIKKAKVLIIDEVSMLSGQTLTAVDAVCRFFRRDQAPFGGLQVVLVGDFFQLPPVVRREEFQGIGMENQDAGGDCPFAYMSPAWRDLDPSICYLLEQHRQSDDDAFAELLSAIRANACEDYHIEMLSSRKTAHGNTPASITRLFTHNMDVDRINLAELAKLPGAARSFVMESTGDKVLSDGLKRGCLSPEQLDLKEGAVVMFTKNDPDGRYVNGTLGVIDEFDYEDGAPVVKTRGGGRIAAKRAEWKVAEDENTAKAAITQIPLRLAWAITVHKSQGMSLDAAVIDLANAFEYGQGYVALSRVRSLKGLYLLGWNAKSLRVHPLALEKDTAFRIASESHAEDIRARMERPSRSLKDVFDMEAGLPVSAGNPASDKPAKANKPWVADEEAALKLRFEQGLSVKAIAEAHGRSEGGIRARLVKLGLIMG